MQRDETADETGQQPQRPQHPGRKEDEAAQHEPRARIGLEDQIQEALRPLEIEDEEQRGQQQETQADRGHRETGQRVRGQEAGADAERGDQEGARRDGLGPEVRGHLPPPRPLGMRDIVDGTRQSQQIHSVGRARDRGRLREDAVGLARVRDAADLREQVAPAPLLQLGGERGGLRAHVEELRPRPLLRLADLGRLGGDEPRDGAAGVVEVAGYDGLDRADHDAGRLEAGLHAMGTVVALGRGVRLGIDVERVVGAGLHARLAADAPRAVEVHDAVRPAVERHRRADRHAGRVIAVIAAHHREVAPRVREHALLDVLHPGAVDAQRDLVLLLAGHRAGVAADTLPLVDHEAVAHASG